MNNQNICIKKEKYNSATLLHPRLPKISISGNTITILYLFLYLIFLYIFSLLFSTNYLLLFTSYYVTIIILSTSFVHFSWQSRGSNEFLKLQLMETIKLFDCTKVKAGKSHKTKLILIIIAVFYDNTINRNYWQKSHLQSGKKVALKRCPFYCTGFYGKIIFNHLEILMVIFIA